MKKSFMFVTLLSLSCSSLTLAAPQWPLDDAESAAVFQSLPVVTYQAISWNINQISDSVEPSQFPLNTAAFAVIDPTGNMRIALRFMVEEIEGANSAPLDGGDFPRCSQYGKIYTYFVYNHLNAWRIQQLLTPTTARGFELPLYSSITKDLSANLLVQLIRDGFATLNICISSPGVKGRIRLAPNTENTFTGMPVPAMAAPKAKAPEAAPTKTAVSTKEPSYWSSFWSYLGYKDKL